MGVNVVLLIGFSFILTSILLENSPDLYEWYYYVTYDIQPVIIYSWFVSLLLSPVLALTFSLRFGAELRKTICWKISIAIMILAGVPSLALAVVGYLMRGI